MLSEQLARGRRLFRQHGPGFLLEALFNFILPFLVYDLSRRRLGDVGALLASSGPPIGWSMVLLVRKRRVDAVSILVLGGIALSLLAFIGGGSARFLQLRETMVTALIGLIFLGSAAIGRPLVYQLARASLRRRSSSELQSFESLRDNPNFRRSMTLMTLVWGFGLVGQAGVAAALVFALSIHDFLLLSPVLGYGTMGALGLWTFLYVRHKRRLRAARDAVKPS